MKTILAFALMFFCGAAIATSVTGTLSDVIVNSFQATCSEDQSVTVCTAFVDRIRIPDATLEAAGVAPQHRGQMRRISRAALASCIASTTAVP